MNESTIGDNNNENQTDETQSSSTFSDQIGALNGLNNCKNSTNLSLNKPTPDLDYLTQLLKDKKQLVAFPNVFTHIEKLLDDEISRVRVILFQCKFTRESLQIPEPIGEVEMRQEKIFVPVKNHPDYNFVGRILGPRGMTAKQLETETGCKIMVRGKGSMRDKKKEDMNRGKANWEHLQEELHVLIQCEDTPNRIDVKMKRAIEEVNKLLIPSPEGEDELKKKQLMELAIINGTYRTASSNSTTQNGQSQAFAAAAAVAAATAAAAGKQNPLLNIDQRLFAGFALPTAVFPSNVTATNGTLQSPGLAGAPLIMHKNNSNNNSNNNQQNNQTGRVSVTTNGISPVSGLSVVNNNQTTNAANLAAAAALQMQMNGIVNPAAAAQLFAQQVPGLNLAQTTPATATNIIPNQAAVDYQMLLNSMQYDQTAALAQLQQQQQFAALMQQASNANALNINNTQNLLMNSAVNSFNDYSTAAAAAAAAAAAGLPQSFNINNQATGSILAQQRRILGQSRDHPYLKRENT